MKKEMGRKILDRITTVIHKFNIQVCYLFGSYADGTADIHSDIDLAVLFDNFDQEKFTYDFRSVVREDFHSALSDLVDKVDVVFLQATDNIPLQFYIISQGKVLYSADEELRTDFEDRVVKYHMDLLPFLEKSYRELKEDLKEGNFIAK